MNDVIISKNLLNAFPQDNIIEGEIRIDPKHHRHFVARRGGVLHRIADECGGVQISFPRAGVDSDRVILKGSHECIEAAKQRMREIVQDLVSTLRTNRCTRNRIVYLSLCPPDRLGIYGNSGMYNTTKASSHGDGCQRSQGAKYNI